MKKLIVTCLLLTNAGCTAVSKPIETQTGSLVVNTESQQQIINVLQSAYRDTAMAVELYQAASISLNNMRPFPVIVRAKKRFLEELEQELKKLQVTPKPFLPAKFAIDTALKACNQAVIQEVSSITLYEKKLLPTSSAYPSIHELLTRFVKAGKNTHLPSFQHCVEIELLK